MLLKTAVEENLCQEGLVCKQSSRTDFALLQHAGHARQNRRSKVRAPWTPTDLPAVTRGAVFRSCLGISLAIALLGAAVRAVAPATSSAVFGSDPGAVQALLEGASWALRPTESTFFRLRVTRRGEAVVGQGRLLGYGGSNVGAVQT